MESWRWKGGEGRGFLQLLGFAAYSFLLTAATLVISRIERSSLKQMGSLEKVVPGYLGQCDVDLD